MNAIMSGGVQIRTRGVFVKTLLYYYEAMNTIMSGVYRYFGAYLRHTVFFKGGGGYFGGVYVHAYNIVNFIIMNYLIHIWPPTC